MPFTTPARAARPAVHPGGHRDVPAQAAARRGGRARRRCCGPAWSPTSRPTRRGSGCGGASCCCSSCCSSSILALLAARPFLERPAGLARDVVLVLDTSASMAATDVTPNRLEAAKAAALDALRDLPTGGKVSVVAADRTARIVVNETTDLGGSARRSTAIEPTQRDAATSATRSSSPASSPRARATPRSWSRPTARSRRRRPARSTAPIKVLPVGRVAQEPGDRRARRPDRAVGGDPVGVHQRREPRPRAAPSAGSSCWGDGGLLEVRDLLLDPQARADVVIDDVPRDVGTLEVRLVGPDPAVTAAPDDLAIDDRAWAVVPPDRTRLILLVGEGDPYLETALELPAQRRAVRRDAATSTGRRPSGPDGRPWDLVIFEGALAGDAAADADPGHRARRRSSPLGEVTGHAQEPGHRLARARTSRSCATSTCPRPTSPRRRGSTLPDWARTVIPGPERRAAALRGRPGRAADRGPRLRAAPLRPAAPGRVPDPARQPDRRADGRLGGAGRGGPARDAGQPDDPGRCDRAAVTRPDGSVVELVPGHRSGDRRHVRRDRPARDLHGDAAPGAGRDGGPSASARPSHRRPPRRRRRPGAGRVGRDRPSPPRRPPVDPNAPVRFAVDLFDVDESTIAPGSAADHRGARARRRPPRPARRREPAARADRASDGPRRAVDPDRR